MSPPVPIDGSDDAKRSVLPESFGTPVQPAAAVDCLPMVEEHHQSKCAVAEQTHVQSVRASKPSRPVSLGPRKKRFTSSGFWHIRLEEPGGHGRHIHEPVHVVVEQTHVQSVRASKPDR